MESSTGKNKGQILSSADEYFNDSKETQQGSVGAEEVLEETEDGSESEITENKSKEGSSVPNGILKELAEEESSRAPKESDYQESPKPLLEEQELPPDLRPRALFTGLVPQKGFFTRKDKYLWGIDLGSHTIKIVGLKEKSNGHKLIFLSLVEIIPGYPLPNHEKSYRNAVLVALAKAMEGMEEWQKEEFVSSIGSNVAVVRQIQYPTAVKEKLLSALQWETRKYIPYEPEEVIVDAQILYTREELKKMDVLLSAVPKKDLGYHKKLLNEAGLNPVIVDTDAMALMNALMAQITLNEEDTVLLIDIGARITIVNMFQKKGLFFTRSLSIAGDRFTRNISSRLKVDFAQAEALKRGEPVVGIESSPKKIFEILKPSFGQLFSEIQKSIVFYNKQTNIKKFHYLFLSGGGVNLPGLKEYISKILGKEISLLSPIADLEVDGVNITKEALAQYGPQIALSIGLALRNKED